MNGRDDDPFSGFLKKHNEDSILDIARVFEKLREPVSPFSGLTRTLEDLVRKPIIPGPIDALGRRSARPEPPPRPAPAPEPAPFEPPPWLTRPRERRIWEAICRLWGGRVPSGLKASERNRLIADQITHMQLTRTPAYTWTPLAFKRSVERVLEAAREAAAREAAARTADAVPISPPAAKATTNGDARHAPASAPRAVARPRKPPSEPRRPSRRPA